MLGTDLSEGRVVMDKPTPEKERKVETAKQLISQVKRQSRRRVSAEDKVRIAMEGLRGEISISDLCRREKITKPTYYRWLKSFLEAGKGRLRQPERVRCQGCSCGSSCRWIPGSRVPRGQVACTRASGWCILLPVAGG